MKLSMSEKIRELLKEKNITIKELSTQIGRTNQNMANKLKRDNFSMNELIEIAEALDCNLEVKFTENNAKK
jgi:DNA-binding Xre family transcriptional regulator